MSLPQPVSRRDFLNQSLAVAGGAAAIASGAAGASAGPAGADSLAARSARRRSAGCCWAAT